jgi:predicted CXXCH cytochrome family protein
MKSTGNILKRLLAAKSWALAHRRKTGLIFGALLVAGAAISCGTLNRSLVAPPNIPGATYIGTESCEDCHKELVKDFTMSTHARLKAPGDNAKDIGCESCHGAGSIHKEAGGGRGTIINPKKSPDVCFQCHQDKRAAFSLPSHHPVIEGKLACGDCHDPHKGDAVIGGGTQMMSESEVCGKCHTTQFGPFTFEHEAMKEGCATCHQPHGSVNQKMLITRNNALCLKCHFEQQSGHNASAGGSCWSAGCHEAVHGSQVYNRFRY